MKKETLIIGGGIAGLTLALEFQNRNLPFRLIDSGENHSSRVAAGIINPVVFRRMALSWRIADFLPEVKCFYRELELKSGENFLHAMPIRRAFAHQQEVDLWLKKQDEPDYQGLIKKLDESDQQNDTVHNTFGTGLVLESFYISTQDLLDHLHSKFKQSGNLSYSRFDYNKLDPETTCYEGTAYERIVFCEGYHGIYNPWFSYLPLQATKGELLTVSSDELPEDESLNRKCFVLPLGNNHFKVGATYTWNTPDTIPTDKAQEELVGHLKNLSPAHFQVEKHEAGVRPTVLDRRPLIGEHPKHKNLFIFNGLGAKGYLLAPLLVKEFVSHVLEKTPLDREISIERYNKFL